MFTVFQDESESETSKQRSVRTQVTPVAHVGTRACTSLLPFYASRIVIYPKTKTDKHWTGSDGQSSLSATKRIFSFFFIFQMYLFLFPDLKGESENLTRCVIYHCLSSPIAHSSAILFTRVLFSKKNNNNDTKKELKKNTHTLKILEKMLPGLFPKCKYVEYVNLYLF